MALMSVKHWSILEQTFSPRVEVNTKPVHTPVTPKLFHGNKAGSFVRSLLLFFRLGDLRVLMVCQNWCSKIWGGKIAQDFAKNRFLLNKQILLYFCLLVYLIKRYHCALLKSNWIYLMLNRFVFNMLKLFMSLKISEFLNFSASVVLLLPCNCLWLYNQRPNYWFHIRWWFYWHWQKFKMLNFWIFSVFYDCVFATEWKWCRV